MTSLESETGLGPDGAVALRLTQALATRLCHDLAGAVFTLAGALELAEEDADSLALAREASGVLQARLRLLRAAWGQAETTLSGAALGALLAGVPLGRRMALRLEGLDPSLSLQAEQARLVLCLALLGAESLHGEGELWVSQPDAVHLQIAISGRNAAWPEEFASMLAGDVFGFAAPLEPRDLVAPLCALQARQERISLRVLPDRLILRLS